MDKQSKHLMMAVGFMVIGATTMLISPILSFTFWVGIAGFVYGLIKGLLEG